MLTETEKAAPQQQTPLLPGGEHALGHAAAAGAEEAEDRAQPRTPPDEHVRQQRGRGHHRGDNRGSLRGKRNLESCPPGQHLPTARVRKDPSPAGCSERWDGQCKDEAAGIPDVAVFLI